MNGPLRNPHKTPREKRPNGRIIGKLERSRKFRGADPFDPYDRHSRRPYNGSFNGGPWLATRDIDAGTIVLAKGTILYYEQWCTLLTRQVVSDLTWGEKGISCRGAERG